MLRDDFVAYFPDDDFFGKVSPLLPCIWPREEVCRPALPPDVRKRVLPPEDPRRKETTPARKAREALARRLREVEDFTSDMLFAVRRDRLPPGRLEPHALTSRHADLLLYAAHEGWKVRARRWKLAFVAPARRDLGPAPIDGLFDVLAELLAFRLRDGNGRRLEVSERAVFPAPHDAAYARIEPEAGGGFLGGRHQALVALSDGKLTLVAFEPYRWLSVQRPPSAAEVLASS